MTEPGFTTMIRSMLGFVLTAKPRLHQHTPSYPKYFYGPFFIEERIGPVAYRQVAGDL